MVKRGKLEEGECVRARKGMEKRVRKGLGEEIGRRGKCQGWGEELEIWKREKVLGWKWKVKDEEKRKEFRVRIRGDI